MRTRVATAVTGRWLPSTVLALASFYLSTVATLAAWAFVPALFGWTPMLISSGSMTPGINVGDVVVVDQHDGQPLDPGTVVTFRQSDRLVTHRIIEATDDGYITQGDANQQPDSTPLADENIVGTGRVLVPFIALPHHWLATGQHPHLVVVGLITLAALAGASARPQQPRAPRPRPATLPAADPPRPPAPGPNPTTRPAHHQPGMVWHARQAPTATATPARPRRRRPRLVAHIPMVAVLTAVMTIGIPAIATLSDATQTTGAWTGQLAPPTDVTADAGCAGTTPHIDLAWTPNPDADGYDVYRTTDPDAGWTLQTGIDAGATDTWRDDTVTTDTSYHYHLRATASSWHSDPSPTTTATTPASC